MTFQEAAALIGARMVEAFPNKPVATEVRSGDSLVGLVYEPPKEYVFPKDVWSDEAALSKTLDDLGIKKP